MNNYTVVSFATPTYTKFLQRLAENCVKLGIPFHSDEYSDRGSRVANTCIKPEFIIKSLKELKTPVLWIDCDCRIEQKFEIPLLDADVGTVYNRVPHHKNRISGGLVWFNYSTGSQKLLNDWYQRCKKQTRLDHPLLCESIKALRKDVSITDITPFVVDKWTINGFDENKKHYTG